MAKRTRRAARKATSSRKAKGARRTAPNKRSGGKRRVTARSGSGRRKTARGKATSAKTRRKPRSASAASPKRKSQTRQTRRSKPQIGGTGREETLAQTPETGRSSQGPTNPMPTKRSTGTPSGAGNVRHVPGLERARRQLREVDETVASPPSSLNPNRLSPSAARSGRQELRESLREHSETSPELTGGDVDADWEDAYSVGDEAPGGDNPTPDQDRVDDIGKALGVEYQDNEPLKGSDKVAERDRHRWELDPASSEDYQDRD
jgi:uncharacterized protein DUF6335